MLSPRNEHHFIGSLFSAIGNAFATADTNDANERQAQLNRSFQREEAKKTRNWQEEMWNKQNEYNSPEAMISRGLNPFTQSASGTGASVPTGAQAGSVSTPSMHAQLVERRLRKISDGSNSQLRILASQIPINQRNSMINTHNYLMLSTTIIS